jgi:hypothetical protein
VSSVPTRNNAWDEVAEAVTVKTGRTTNLWHVRCHCDAPLAVASCSEPRLIPLAEQPSQSLSCDQAHVCMLQLRAQLLPPTTFDLLPCFVTTIPRPTALEQHLAEAS